MGKRGRPPVLDGKKRTRIVAIIGAGCSQNMAAQYVGCAQSTIRRTAERDPAFAEELRRARCNAELSLVKNIRDAAKKEQYWRAAAWALERSFPEKYARRGPDVVTLDQIGILLARFAEIIVEDVPEKMRKLIIKKTDAMARGLGVKMKWEAKNDQD